MPKVVELRGVTRPRGLVGGPFGSSLMGKDYRSNGVPVIRGGNMGPGQWVGGEFAFVSHEKFRTELSRNSAEPGDLVFTQRGTLGQVAIVPPEPFRSYVVSQSQMRLRVDETRFDRRFVFYACSSPQFRKQIWDHAISTGVPHINLGILSGLKIPSFDLSEQRGIAEVLGALDDKIAANSRLKTTIDDLLAAEFARVTEGSEFGCLGAIADVNVDSTKAQTSGSIHYVDIASVGVGRYELSEPIDWRVAPGRARRVLRCGDTVWSTVRPNRRSHALVLDEYDNLVASTGLAVLTPKRGRFAFVYEATRTEVFTAYLEGVAEGSAYPAVRGERFASAPTPVVNEHQIDQFEGFAAPLRTRLHSATLESRTLVKIRDTFLPQLISGKIRVKDAERVVEGVV